MEVQILGPLQVRIEESHRAVDAPKQRLIFGVLLDRVGQVVTADRLLDEVWSGSPPDGGVKTLRYHVSKLRDVLVPDRAPSDDGPILTVGAGYRLVVDPDKIDANRFERLRAEGADLLANRRWADAYRVLSNAVGLWQGDAWQDFRYDEFAQATIIRLEELRLTCTEDLIDADLGRGNHLDLIGELKELTTRHPLRERFWAQSMIALYRAGRQTEAAGVYDTACAVLGEKLGVAPNQALQRLHQQVVDQSFPFRSQDQQDDGDTNLPRRNSSFVGRRRELQELEDLLRSHRLVTLVGTGGVGKTSLAVEAARQAADVADTMFFVDLTAVAESVDVAPHVARSVGVAGSAGRATIDDTIEYLADRSHLLVVDNCEHVVEAIAEIIDLLLRNCPNVTVVATARQPLHLDGEQVSSIDPLPLPLDEADADENDAVRLFADRAAAARSGFSIDEGNRAIVVDTCRRLDGLPLAIELAAARLHVLSITELHDRLDQRFELLASTKTANERHRTLWAAVDWSYQLLTSEEQALLRGLSVLLSRFDLDAVAAVCFADPASEVEVLSVIGQLIDTSFLIRGNDPDGGFTMLETIREYANEQLQLSGESDALSTRHARYFAGQTIKRPPFGSHEELELMRRMRTDNENLTSALDWSLRRDHPDLAIQLASGIALHWYTAARGDEALRWLVTALDDGDRTASPERAEALCSLGLALPWMGRHEEAAAVADELDRVAAQLRTPEVDADALWVRAANAAVAGDLLVSRRLVDLASSVLRLADHPKLTVLLWELAYRELLLGNIDRAAVLVDEVEELGARWQQPLTTARVSLLRGQLVDFDGDHQQALSHLTTSLAEMRRLGVVGPQVHPLRSICDTAVVAQQWPVAEGAAREFIALAKNTGELAALPHGHNALAAAALARDEVGQAAVHLAAGIEVIRGTRSAAVLDQTLLTAAKIARALDRPRESATLYAERAQRRRIRGLVDPIHVARMIARETEQLSEELGEVVEPLSDEKSLLDLATAATRP